MTRELVEEWYRDRARIKFPERIAVVEVDARPNRLRRKYSARVPIENDIEEAARADLGPRNIFTRAALISRVVIAVKYRAPGDKEPKTLNLTLSDPNRCNLLSNRDEGQRALGYSLLEKWRILKPLRSLSATEQRNLLPLLLMLHDLSDDQVSGAFLKRRGIDAEFLVESGFLERRSRDSSMLIDESMKRTAVRERARSAAFEAAGAVVLGLFRDPVASHDRFAAKHGLNLTLLSDETGGTVEDYGAWVEKSMYGRKYMGVDRSTFLIDRDGVLRQAWRKVKVPGHVDEVLAAARAL